MKKNIKNRLILILILLSIISCKNKKIIIEKIEFSNEYKFSSEIERKVEADTIAWKYQISAADYAIKGDYQNALIQWDLAMGTRERNYTLKQIDSINQKYKIVSAKKLYNRTV